jgi:hypothetical protein
MCVDLSRVESKHFLKKPYRRFLRRRDFTALQNSTLLTRGGSQKSESNQARSAAFGATGGEPDANARQPFNSTERICAGIAARNRRRGGTAAFRRLQLSRLPWRMRAVGRYARRSGSYLRRNRDCCWCASAPHRGAIIQGRLRRRVRLARHGAIRLPKSHTCF